MRKGWKITWCVVGVIALTTLLNRVVFTSAWLAKWQALELKVPNPTEHVFEASREEVKNAVWRQFEEKRYRGLTLYGFGRGLSGRKDTTGTAGEEYFTLTTSVKRMESFSYRRWGEGLPVELYMQLHLDSLGPQQTRVRVITTQYKVETGWVIGLGLHFYVGPMPKERDLPPTTVEEYQVLYNIGKELDVAESMPRVQYPERLSRKKLEDTYYNRGIALRYRAHPNSSWDKFEE